MENANKETLKNKTPVTKKKDGLIDSITASQKNGGKGNVTIEQSKLLKLNKPQTQIN